MTQESKPRVSRLSTILPREEVEMFDINGFICVVGYGITASQALEEVKAHDMERYNQGQYHIIASDVHTAYVADAVKFITTFGDSEVKNAVGEYIAYYIG